MTTPRDPDPLAAVSVDVDAEAEALVRRLMPDGWTLRVWAQDSRFGGSPWAVSVDRPGMPRLNEDPASYTAHWGSTSKAGALLHVAAALADRLSPSPSGTRTTEGGTDGRE